MTEKSVEILKIYGKNLKKIREIKGFTIEQLSDKTKIRKQYLNKIEKGEASGLSISKVFLIAEVLDTPAWVFVCGL